MYSHAENIQTIIEQTKKTIRSGDINSYDLLKSSCPKKDWDIMLEEILAELETKRTLPAIYEHILITENLQEKIIQYCTIRPSKIVKMYKYIDDLHYTHVSQLFRICVRDYAKRANDRDKYIKLCKLLRIYRRACGKSDVKEIYDEFIEIYSFRPAMLEELYKMKGMD